MGKDYIIKELEELRRRALKEPFPRGSRMREKEKKMTLKLKKEINKEEQETYEEDDSPVLPPPDIVAYNELRSCADLFRMYTQGILKIQPEFQREIVWKPADQTRFIDSLVKELPIPSMCFSYDYKEQKWLVIDGLQRMATIIKFLSGENWKLSNLKDIDRKLAGRNATNFVDKNNPLHEYYTRVENLTLPITVIRCDYSKNDHMNYLFTIFHRLNAGGMRLNNQEIRNCIYSGAFNNLLKELDKYVPWMRLNKMKKGKSYRFTKQELTLRLFAFHDNYSNYQGRLASFLNNYMKENRKLSKGRLEKKKALFNQTVDIVFQRIFEGKVPPKLSVTVLEAVLVGVSFNIKHLESIPPKKAQILYQELLRHEEFTEEKLSEGLSGKPRVIGRIKAAKSIFAK